jgi:hypothetical protein
MALQSELKSADVELACKDLRERTLANIPGDFARLIYLASTRDYNSGEYHHAGLARRFKEDVARRALAICHEEVFRRLVLSSVAELVQQLETYVRSTRLPLLSVVRAWSRLQTYRVTIPMECSSLTARLFDSNVRAALAILAARQNLSRSNPQPASPLQ